VIPRAEPDSEIQELVSQGRILSPIEKQFYDFCRSIPQNVEEFALSLIGGGAANGGKSEDQREGGC